MLPLVVCRVLHIAAACSSFGGLLYARAVLWPALRGLPAASREPLLASAMRRFAPIKWAGVGVVAVTGVAQWALLRSAVHDPRAYAGWFVLKMAGAVGLFVTTLLLALPHPALARMHRRRGLWAGLNLVFAAVILTGAALMHLSR
jgi:uncharacterized membrane protein